MTPLVELVSPKAAAGFAELTFPAHRDLVATPPKDREMIYVGATKAGEPAGFAFGMGGPRGEFELFSVYVQPFSRNAGLGRALLNRLEAAFAARGYRLGVHFFTVDPDDQDYARFLKHAGWSHPALRQIVCKTTLDNAYQTPWLVKAKLPDGYEVRAWTGLSDAERADLETRKSADADLYPDSLDPFVHEANCHPETSVALFRGSKVVGWQITHQLDEDTLRWTCSYVMPVLQGAARILPLWWATAQRQRELTSLQRFIWTVPLDQPRMVKFVVRRMRPWLTALNYACITTKPVSSSD